MFIASASRLWLATALALVALLAWDATGLDMAMAQWFGGPAGFPLRQHWLFSAVLHEGGRFLSWGVALWLCAGVWLPTGWLRRIQLSRRVQLALTTLLAVLVVSGLKAFSPTSCPWDLAAFGRSARYLSHWALGSDGGSGHCFPAGHASVGFAFVGGYFAFRRRAPALACGWLTGALLAGLMLGLAQQVRGAHFMSHTLWTGWLCWLTALLVDTLWTLLPPPGIPLAHPGAPR
jgi:membrane-associated PAP2 superfamily phosphatase